MPTAARRMAMLQMLSAGADRPSNPLLKRPWGEGRAQVCAAGRRKLIRADDLGFCGR